MSKRVSAAIPPVDYDAPSSVIVPVEVWDSGPVLLTNTNNRKATSTYLPGEGRITSTFEEGSKVWKHKTRRKYYEDVKKPPRESTATLEGTPSGAKKAIVQSPTKVKSKHNADITPNKKFLKGTSSSQHTSADSYSRNDPKGSMKERHTVKYVEDKSTQCNLKKTSKPKFEISQDFRVIKPAKDGSVTAYSDVSNMADFTDPKKKSFQDDDFIVEKNATLINRRQGTPSPVRRTVVTKSYSLDAGNSLAHVGLPKVNQEMKPRGDWYYRDGGEHVSSHPHPLTRETIEETISLTSSDDFVDNHINSRGTGVKSVIRELDGEKKIISYENGRLRRKDVLDENIGNGSSLWFKAPEDDYRRNMAQNDVSFNCIGVKEPGEQPCRVLAHHIPDKSPISVLGSQSYTLDRKHLRAREQGRTSANGFVYRKAPSLPSNSEKVTRRFNSSRDISSRTESGNESLAYRRGGLAAAYKNRQERASSLNRTIGQQHMRSSTLSLGPSRVSVHENEPVVMYIPAVSHHRRPVDEEDDRLSGIQRSQSILSNRRGVKSSSGVTWASHVKQNEMQEGKRGRDLKRSQSIPKDTKFPWLSRLRLRSKSKEQAI